MQYNTYSPKNDFIKKPSNNRLSSEKGGVRGNLSVAKGSLKTRFDFVFSYWIFAWYMFYALGITTYSPKAFLILSVSINILILLSMIYYKNSLIYILLFVVANFIIKIIPIILIHHITIKTQDYYAGAGLFIIYNIWLHINGTSFIEIMKNQYDAIVKNKVGTPFMTLALKTFGEK
jgi:hypothetical protein